MSVFGGRRTSSPAQGRARSSDAAPQPAGDPQTRAPHFRPPPLAPADLETVAEARLILEDLRVHIDELDRREQSLNAQLTRLEREQRDLNLQTQQFEAERRARQQALDNRERTLAEREAAATLLAGQAHEQQQAVDLQQSELDRRRADLRDELWAEIADERRQLQELRIEVERSAAELADAQAGWNAQHELEITEHTALLDQLRAERLADVEAREADAGRREVDLVKRTRFQEEHLARVRSAIAARQAELERSRAALTVWSEQVESTARGRLAHLRKYRDVLEQREHACESAWQALADARDQQQALLDELRTHVAAEQAAFADEQRALAGDFRRHAELLRLRELEVERRTARMDQAHDELQRRLDLLDARETAVREAAAWLGERIGVDAADMLVPRDDLPAVPAPDVAAQRAEIADAQRQLAHWQQELHDEREALARMSADREQRLRHREAALGRQLELLAAREEALQQAQTRDRIEREQTFAVLEALVEQVERRLRGD